jgi:serine/threonine-protein kinase
MGEVHRATDTKLKRDVAIKALPSHVAADPGWAARFEREARALAMLNHPGIAAIYGLLEHDGRRFLVLELVEGETLAARLQRGPLSPDEASRTARQIAEALEAAHDEGIIHRDLKPANIALTPDGAVKLLDFGLAKTLESQSGLSASVANSPTFTGMTESGVILGTAAYMSPEQARGKAVDRRTHIWAFGCVWFEMLTGTQAFDGETVSDVIGGILRAEPDWSKLLVTSRPWSAACCAGVS